MTTQELELLFWQFLPFIVCAGVAILLTLAFTGRNKAAQCPTPDASISKILEKQLAHLIVSAQSKEFFLQEAEKLWDARVLLTPKK